MRSKGKSSVLISILFRISPFNTFRDGGQGRSGQGHQGRRPRQGPRRCLRWPRRWTPGPRSGRYQGSRQDCRCYCQRQQLDPRETRLIVIPAKAGIFVALSRHPRLDRGSFFVILAQARIFVALSRHPRAGGRTALSTLVLSARGHHGGDLFYTLKPASTMHFCAKAFASSSFSG